MARGSEAKSKIIEKMLKVFDQSFLVDGKELRIPYIENGELLQIKCSFVCAKENIAGNVSRDPVAPADPTANKITEEEKQDVRDLISSLGL